MPADSGDPAACAQQRRLVEALHDVLPQTQCTRCGYPDCRRYAEAIAEGGTAINRCPPGGAEGIARLAALTGQARLPLDPAHGSEAARMMAAIDEARCIGCTLCIAACPVDCIVGAPKAMHTVIEAHCTGCALCLPACPVDCIDMVPLSADAARSAVPDGADRSDMASTPTAWQTWSAEQAASARARYAAHQQRSARTQSDAEARLATAASRLQGTVRA